tara:strand:- start:2740 stop:3189 length:450 start_codon:yes stop_codon:yes gene_type:complete
MSSDQHGVNQQSAAIWQAIEAEHMRGRHADADVDDIAAEITTLICKAVDTGYFPQLKCDVETHPIDGGGAIEVAIVECSTPPTSPRSHLAMREIQRLLDKLQRDSASQHCDVFEVSFYNGLCWHVGNQIYHVDTMPIEGSATRPQRAGA